MFYFSRMKLSFSSTFPEKITIFKTKLKTKHSTEIQALFKACDHPDIPLPNGTVQVD